jgi:hypothetical protein
LTWFDKVDKGGAVSAAIWWNFTIDGACSPFYRRDHTARDCRLRFAPAVSQLESNAAEVMKKAGGGNSSRLVNVITRVLVVGQIALTAALLIARTLQIKSIRNQTKLDYGYDENGVYAARLALMEGTYPTRRFASRILQASCADATHSSAIRSGGHDRSVPHDLRRGGQYEVDGQKYQTDRDRPAATSNRSRTAISRRSDLKILEGRDFTIDDTDSKQPVAIVNASFARKYWGNAERGSDIRCASSIPRKNSRGAASSGLCPTPDARTF